MEPNKLEKQFKKQLNSREIKPSEISWNKLDALLTESEKRKFNWIYIAASFIGFLLIGTLYFSQNESEIGNQKDKIVNQQSVSPKNQESYSRISHPNPQNSENKAIVNIQKVTLKNNKKLTLKKDSLIPKNNSSPNQIAEFSIINQKKEPESNSLSTKDLTVDELLASVNQSSRLNNKPDPNLKVHVNANLLLQQMNTDLEPTFRQNVFSKVADNFKAIKEAVVNRNKE